jgi:voltage-gated sodium channel
MADLAPPGTAWAEDGKLRIAAEEMDNPETMVKANQSAQPESPGVRCDRRNTGLFEFTDAEAIRAKVMERQQTSRSSYKVTDMYHSTGIFQAIAKDARFENLTLGVICANAIWIAVDTDYNSADSLLDASPVFIAADVIFFAYFSIELFIRFCAFKRKTDCMKDGWFVFDTFLVTLYLLDPFIMAAVMSAMGGGALPGGSLPRLLRLARLSRLVRMLKALPELLIMVKGIGTATSSVSYTMFLLILATYVFAIALTQLSEDTEFGETFLHGVAESMYTLIIYCAFFDDLSVYADAVKAESTVCMIISVFYMVIAGITILNMLIGILCEVISAVAAEERESIAVDLVYARFEEIVDKLDEDKSKKISWVEFQKIMDMPEALAAFEEVKVDPEGVIDFAEDWFTDEKGQAVEINIGQFVEMVLELRMGKDVTMKDMMIQNKRFNTRFAEAMVMFESISQKVDKLAQIQMKNRR